MCVLILALGGLLCGSECGGPNLMAFWADAPGHGGAADKAAGPTADEALQRLRDGNARFVIDRLAPRPSYAQQRSKLAASQHPFAIILTCSDSRVVPEMIFNQELGQLFVHRVAGNVTDSVLLGSIEYAVEHLHVPLIVVLGHSNCGAVQAAVNGGPITGNLGDLVARVHLGDHLPSDKKAAVAAGVRANVIYHSYQMTKRSSVIRHAAKEGKVQIVGGVYSLETGEVDWLGKAQAPGGHGNGHSNSNGHGGDHGAGHGNSHRGGHGQAGGGH